MQYLDNEADMKELMDAADRISGWADDQMASMRRPNKPMHEEAGETPNEEASESPKMERQEMESGMEQPLDAPPPRDMGKPMMRDKTVLEVIEPGIGANRKPPPKYDTGIDEWTNETVRKLDKFGKKLPRR
jgi:hypothetical protein